MADLLIAHPDILNTQRTALTSASAVAAASLSVENGTTIPTGYALVDGYGNARAEIVTIQASAASSLTLTGTTAFSHDVSASVQTIPYNQVAIETSTDLATLFATGLYATPNDASAVATWSTLTTVSITPSQKEGTFYRDTAGISRSYRTRFYNSAGAYYGSYSDPILPTGFEEFAVAKIINKALEQANVNLSQQDGYGQFTYAYLVDRFNDGLRYVQSKRKRWSWNMSFDQTMSEITGGVNSYLLPTAIDYRPTYRSLFNVRVNDQQNLTYMDKRSYDRYMENVHTSTLGGSLTSGSGTITLADTSDFGDSGSFIVVTGSTKDTISYTANNRTTNTLTLSSPNGATTTHASGTTVWQNASFSNTPLFYTVISGYLKLWPIPDQTLYQKTVKVDYYKKLIEVNSANDYLIFPHPLLLEYYLLMVVHERLDNTEKVGYYKALLEEMFSDLIRNEETGQNRQFIPVTNNLGYENNIQNYQGFNRDQFYTLNS